MKFSCERDLLMREIQTAQEIISSRNALSILSNVLLQAEGEQLAIRATDLKVGFETGLAVDVSDPGVVTVYCEKLLSILRALPEGEVEFAVEDNSSFVIRPRFKKIDFRLKSISDNVTEMIIDVGTFGEKRKAQMIFQKISERL